MLKIAVGGCRYFEDYNVLQSYLDDLLSKTPDENIVVISGHCRGADMLAERYADQRGYGKRIINADWRRYGRAAGVRRNAEMVNEADVIVAFWDDKSRGTASLIKFTEKSGKPLFVKRI